MTPDREQSAAHLAAANGNLQIAKIEYLQALLRDLAFSLPHLGRDLDDAADLLDVAARHHVNVAVHADNWERDVQVRP